MKLLLSSFAILLLTLTGCDRKPKVMGPIDGVYKGTFIRSSPTARYAPSNVTLSIDGNHFSGQSDNAHYPAICSGTFTIASGTITVNNECMFTADFDWSLIFKGDYNCEVNGNQLTITRSQANSITDRYVLEKQ